MRLLSTVLVALLLTAPAVLSADNGASQGDVVIQEGPNSEQAIDGPTLEGPMVDPSDRSEPVEVCEPDALCFTAEECEDLQFCIDVCIEGVGCGSFETGIKYPTGAGVFDPWLDARGDEIVGPLTLNQTELVFHDQDQEDVVLSRTPAGELAVDGDVLCVEQDPLCIGAPISPIDCPPGQHVGVILEDGTPRCDPDVAEGAVDTSALARGAVTRDKIDAGAVNTTELAESAVQNRNIADFAVDTLQLADASVTHSKLAPGAVHSSNILDGSVGEADIARGAVTKAKLATGAVTSSKVVDGSLAESDLADGSVATSKLQDDAVTSVKILTGAVDTPQLANGAVGTDQLADGAVEAAKIGVSCAAGEVLEHTGTAWSCGTDDGITEEEDPTVNELAKTSLACASGQLAKFDGSSWGCAEDVDTTDPNTDTLAELSCTADDITRYDGTNWICSVDQDTTYDGTDFALSDQACASDEVVAGIDANGNIACEVDDGITEEEDPTVNALAKATLGCLDSQIAKSHGDGNWDCREDEGVVLNTTTVVSPTGDPLVDGATLLDAMAAQPGSTDQPRVVLVEPGFYDIGDDKLVVPPGVTLLGSGAQATVIRGQPQGFTHNTVVSLEANATVRALQVETLDPDISFGLGVAGSDALAEDVAVRAGPSDDAVGVRILSDIGDITLRGVDVEVTGSLAAAAVRSDADTLRLERVDALATALGDAVGLDLFEGETEVAGSTFEAEADQSWGLRGQSLSKATIQDSTLSASAPSDTPDSSVGASTEGQLDLRHSEVSGETTGLVAQLDSSVTVLGGALENPTGEALRTSGGSVRADSAHIEGKVVLESGTTYIGGSRLDGEATNLADPGNLRCVVTYDVGYQELDNACQPPTS